MAGFLRTPPGRRWRVCERARSFQRRVRDVSQQLENRRNKERAAVTKDAVTYDSSCHLLYGQHAGEAPLKMVDAIAKLNFVRLEGSERFLWRSGIYNLLKPGFVRAGVGEKLANFKRRKRRHWPPCNPGWPNANRRRRAARWNGVKSLSPGGTG